jgi:kelch-like protein 1/4/5
MMAPLPTASTMGTLACDPTGTRLFLFGGTNATVTNVLNITQIYTIATNTWAAGNNLPAPRSFMSSGVVGGMIYLIGGYSTTLVTPSESQVWRYDPVAGTFTTLAPMTAGKGGAGSGVYQGKIYVMGGRDGVSTQLNTNYEYTVATDTWATRAPLLTAVNVPASASLGGSGTCNQTFILAGGGNPFFHGAEALPRGQGVIETTGISQLYDAVANTWAAGPSLSQGRSFAAASQQGNTLIVVGGYNGSTTVQTVDRIQGPPLPVSLSGFSVQ